MPDTNTLILFSGASLVLLVVPGPAVLYIVARAVEQGRLAGLIAVAGVHIGTMFHIAAAGLGLSAVLISSALAFNVVKYLGALYLIYLGLRTMLGRNAAERSAGLGSRRLSRILVESTIVNMLNPKTALFFFAFLPQFLDPAAGPVAPQIVVLGSIFIAIGLASDGAYALGAGSIGQRLGTACSWRASGKYVTGSIYVALGLLAAVVEPAND